MQGTFTVGGVKVRTSSQRRFVAWVVRRDGSYAPQIMGRSDSIANIRARVQRRGIWSDSFVVIIDTTTGEEVRGW